MNEVEFQLVARADLVQELLEQIPSDVTARVETAAAPRDLQLGPLEASAAVITIVIGGAQLAEFCLKIARAVRQWRADRRTTPVRMVVRGTREDALVEIRDGSDDAAVAEQIRTTASKS